MDTTTAKTNSKGAEGAAHQPLTMAVAEEKKKTKVLVAMDESDGSFYALKWALDHFSCYHIQRDQESSMITLVHGQPIFQPFIYPAGPVSNDPIVSSVDKTEDQLLNHNTSNNPSYTEPSDL
ncbi:unnamed protein product [Fraxinus pennsylvanica]|uniref:UspA domain-containing protein n=1 Tax=Fraxinus pennsylvanica TaxID=56036 RepID=A0AAD1Z1C4_9LAMI|nr:unnamed protein product [Fraxinus pennsylvanica]